MTIFRRKREKSKRKREKDRKKNTILYQFVAAAASKMLKRRREREGREWNSRRKWRANWLTKGKQKCIMADGSST